MIHRRITRFVDHSLDCANNRLLLTKTPVFLLRHLALHHKTPSSLKRVHVTTAAPWRGFPQLAQLCVLFPGPCRILRVVIGVG